MQVRREAARALTGIGEAAAPEIVARSLLGPSMSQLDVDGNLMDQLGTQAIIRSVEDTVDLAWVLHLQWWVPLHTGWAMWHTTGWAMVCRFQVWTCASKIDIVGYCRQAVQPRYLHDFAQLIAWWKHEEEQKPVCSWLMQLMTHWNSFSWFIGKTADVAPRMWTPRIDVNVSCLAKGARHAVPCGKAMYWSQLSFWSICREQQCFRQTNPWTFPQKQRAQLFGSHEFLSVDIIVIIVINWKFPVPSRFLAVSRSPSLSSYTFPTLRSDESRENLASTEVTLRRWGTIFQLHVRSTSFTKGKILRTFTRCHCAIVGVKFVVATLAAGLFHPFSSFIKL